MCRKRGQLAEAYSTSSQRDSITGRDDVIGSRIAIWIPELDSRRDDPGSGPVELQPDLLYECRKHLGHAVDREPGQRLRLLRLAPPPDVAQPRGSLELEPLIIFSSAAFGTRMRRPMRMHGMSPLATAS